MESPDRIFTQHSRSYSNNRFVYPVISRRSGGLSIGVNLNPDKVCNFDCIYCQVDRRSASETRFVELTQLADELDTMLDLALGGELFREGPLLGTPPALQRLCDIAFSGDGEPTTYRNLEEIFSRCIQVKQRHRQEMLKMVLITNASMFHRSRVRKALEIFDLHGGEIWGKLDAGTAEYYHLVDRTTIPFARILENLTWAASVRPIVIQSLFMQIDGVPPTESEIAAYCDRLHAIVAAGGTIRLVQVYTVARRPAESYVGSLSPLEVDRIAQHVRERTKLDAEVYYGVDCHEANEHV